jgi:hypothetical protein
MNLLAVPLVTMEDIAHNSQFSLEPHLHKRGKHGWVRSDIKSTYVKKNVTFYCRRFAENSYFSLYFDRSIITTNSLEEELNFCVSWLLLEVYF